MVILMIMKAPACHNRIVTIKLEDDAIFFSQAWQRCCLCNGGRIQIKIRKSKSEMTECG